MADHVVDTNVLIVASAANGLVPRYADVPVGSDDIQKVFEWVQAFRDACDRRIVLDECFRIYAEYRNKLNDQHFGLLAIHHKLTSCLRSVSVDYDGDGHGVVPPALSCIDNSDKKFVAAALNDPATIHIVNACDGDWKEQAAVLESHGVVVVELLP